MSARARVCVCMRVNVYVLAVQTDVKFCLAVRTVLVLSLIKTHPSVCMCVSPRPSVRPSVRLLPTVQCKPRLQRTSRNRKHSLIGNIKYLSFAFPSMSIIVIVSMRRTLTSTPPIDQSPTESSQLASLIGWYAYDWPYDFAKACRR